MQPFFPETLSGWVALFLELFAVVVAVTAWVLRFVRQPLLEQINGLGRRVKNLETNDSIHIGKLEEQGRRMDIKEVHEHSLTDRVGKLEVKHEQLQETVSRGLGDVRERLASIQSTLDFVAGRLGGER